MSSAGRRCGSATAASAVPRSTSSQYLSRMIPESTIARLDGRGQLEGTVSLSSSVQNPITGSTPARLYQLRSKMTTSPAAGKCSMIPLHVHLRLLALGRSRQGHDAKHPRADPLGDCPDRCRPSLRCRVPRTRCRSSHPKTSPTPALRRVHREADGAVGGTPCSSWVCRSSGACRSTARGVGRRGA